MLSAPVCQSGAWAVQDSPAATAASDAPLYDPAKTHVAVLPVIDRTGEKVEQRRKDQAKNGYDNLIEMFQKHGFQIVPAEAITKAVEDSKLDLNDEEEYRKANFYKLGQAVNADLVVFVCVDTTSEGTKPAGLFTGPEKQGRATIRMWLVDAKQEKPIISSLRKEGKAAGKSPLFSTNDGTKRRIHAVGNAVKEILGEVLKPYPEVKK